MAGTRKGEGIVQTTNCVADVSGENRSGMHNLGVAGSNPAPATYKKATNLIKICGFFIIINLWILNLNLILLNLLL